MKKPSKDWFVVDLSLARKFDEWLACKAEGERLWLEIKRHIAEEGHARAMVRYVLTEKGIKEGGGKPPLFDSQPRKKRQKLFSSSEQEVRVERDMISAAKWAIQKGISSPDFIAIAHKAFKRAANLITSTNNQKLT